jgi:dipeptidyl aminopeptidase/acylaminoacyl peptidase
MMLEHLTRAGKTVTSVELPGDDHHLMTSASRIRMLEAIDSFLAKYLPVDGARADRHTAAESSGGSRS